jgi:hypothetical protein
MIRVSEDINFAFVLDYQGRRNSSVGIATRYRLECLGIASRWGLDFTCTPLPTTYTVGTGSGHRCQFGACKLQTGCLSLQTHTLNMQYLLLFHGNNCYANALNYFATYIRVACRGRLLSPRTLRILAKPSDFPRYSGVSLSFRILMLP